MLRSVRKQGRGWDGVGVGWGRGRFDNGYVAVECARCVNHTDGDEGQKESGHEDDVD